MPVLTSPHIWVDGKGVAWVDDTNTKVKEIALDLLAHGWTAQEIQAAHPHLTLAQIHSSLAYYYDHKDLLDRQIEEGLRLTEKIQSSMGDSPIKKRLEALGKI